MNLTSFSSTLHISPASSRILTVNKITSSSSPPPVKTATTSQPTSLPIRTVPGSYGLPLLGPFIDRMNYSWFQGSDGFFRKGIEKNQSTVFRTNVPPSFPFFLANPNVVAVLDCKSFAYMFDMEIVEKKDILVGDFMPSTQFTGDRRVCAYLDTTEPRHEQIKNFAMDTLKRSSSIWIPTLTTLLDSMFDNIDSQLPSGPVSYLIPTEKFLFSFLSRVIAGANPENSPDMAENGYMRMARWLAVQILPTTPITAFQPLVEIFLHSFPYPYFLVSNDYNKLYEFIEKEGKDVVSRGQTEFNLTKEDTIHNLLFTLGFNAFGGFSIFLPSLLTALQNSKPEIHEKLRQEVREKTAGSGLTFKAVNEMELVQSFVYETLRLNPPVPLQYGRARKDFNLSTYDSIFNIKKGELLCGYQPLVMRDPNIFDDPETFVADRFTNKGKDLLTYLYWSNGPQNGTSSASNKQCAGKDFVTMTASMILAYLFMRYDSVAIVDGSFSVLEKAKQ